MYIKRVRLENWLRYAGNHNIELEPTVYGIVGEWLGEEGRSNWVGKSGFLEAFDFALTGRHRKRTEDEWITYGAEQGGVELDLSNGVSITRTRELGKSTKLTVSEGKDTYKDKEAQAFVYAQVLGCTREDYDLLYYAKQRALAEVVMMKPEPFAETIRQWVGTGPLESVEEAASEQLGKAATKVRELEQAIEAAVADALEGVEDGSDYEPIKDVPEALVRQRLDDVEREQRLAEGVMKIARTGWEAAVKVQDECSEWWEHKAAVDALASTRVQLKALETQLAAIDGVGLELDETDAEKKHANEAQFLSGLQTQQRRLEELTRGVFDGVCPVTLGACPAKAKVLEQGRGNAQTLIDVRQKIVEAKVRVTTAANVLQSVREKLKDLRAGESKVEALRKAMKGGDVHQEYLDANEEPQDKAAAATNVAAAQEKMSDARVELERCTQLAKRLYRRLNEVEAAQVNIEDARAKMARLNRIRRAAGRQGAQRDVAVASMRRVEQLGNALLTDASIPLSFRVRWASEGKRLAGACDACGHVYTGQRDKACPRCKADRPMHSIDRPGLELSDRSGAAEDLVGAAVRLGASAWMRRKRQMPWGVAMIDEPYGALDSANREAFSQYLVSSLRGRFGFEQAFVIAHHDDAMSCLPGRIKVVGTQSGSRVEVVG